MSRIDLHLWGSSSSFETSISSLPSFSLLVNVDQLILRPCNRYVLQVFFLLKFPVFLCPRTRDRRTPSEEENSIPFTALRFMNRGEGYHVRNFPRLRIAEEALDKVNQVSNPIPRVLGDAMVDHNLESFDGINDGLGSITLVFPLPLLDLSRPILLKPLGKSRETLNGFPFCRELNQSSSDIPAFDPTTDPVSNHRIRSFDQGTGKATEDSILRGKLLFQEPRAGGILPVPFPFLRLLYGPTLPVRFKNRHFGDKRGDSPDGTPRSRIMGL